MRKAEKALKRHLSLFGPRFADFLLFVYTVLKEAFETAAHLSLYNIANAL
jgi:hypothetical protein